MAYTIRKSDGSILLTLGDSRINQLATSLTLIGKNIESYGEYYNNNMVSILENFASATEPRAPLAGQLWFNSDTGKMYVYGTQNAFKLLGGAQISSSQPTIFDAGDFWVDSTSNQLYFSPDGSSFVLAGPEYSTAAGKSGWIVESITDNTNVARIVASLYSNNTLLGIVSATEFTFSVPFNGMTSVAVGFNLNPSIPGVRFIGTATSADSFNGIDATEFLNKNTDNITTGTLTVLNDRGVEVGANADLSIYVSSSTVNIDGNVLSRGITLRANNNPLGYYTALHVDATNRRLGILTGTPTATLDVNGDANIVGSLVVQGPSTLIASTNFYVNDINVQFGYGQVSPSDAVVEGGGITLIGSRNHNISWTQSYSGAWQLNDNLNLTTTTSSYKINGSTVISSSALGAGISSAPGVTSIGTLSQLTVSNVTITGSTIATTGSNVNLNLTTSHSTGTINVNSRKITNLSTCTANSDAANKSYVDTVTLFTSRGYGFTVDVTGAVNTNTFVITYLNKILPVTNSAPDEVFNLPNGTRARVLCQNSVMTTGTQTVSISQSTTLVNGTQTVVTNVAGTVPAVGLVPTYTYFVKEFRVASGTWQWTADIP